MINYLVYKYQLSLQIINLKNEKETHIFIPTDEYIVSSLHVNGMIYFIEKNLNMFQ